MKLFSSPRDDAEIAAVLARAELATLMVPFVREQTVKEACEAAVRYGMAGVLAVPDICLLTTKFLAGTGVKPVAVISAMEVGDNDAESRGHLLKELLKIGVKDADLGVPTGMVLDGEFAELEEEIRVNAGILHAEGGSLGIILEIDQLTPQQLLDLCETACKGGADYIRTASGMEAIGAGNIGRATIYNVALLYEKFGDRIKIKAGGGWDFAWLEDMNEYLEAGAALADAGECTLTQLERIGYGKETV